MTIGLTRRRRRTAPRPHSDAHDPVPDDVVGPTPRSQIRMRMRSAPRPSRTRRWSRPETRVRLERRAQPVKTLVGRLRAEHDALRVAEVHDDRVHGFAGGVMRDLLDVRRQPHRGAKRRAHASRRPAVSPVFGPASVAIVTAAPTRSSRAAVAQPSARTPLPDTSGGAPSALNSCIVAPAVVRPKTIRPSAPMPV